MKTMTSPRPTTTEVVYIGLDNHKSSNSLAWALEDGQPPHWYGKVGGSMKQLERALQSLLGKIGQPREAARIAYEAGPGGFSVARHLIKAGYEVIVVAPTKMEKAPGDQIKTDRRDALKLARHYRAGSLEGIYIPDEKTEAVRDLCRARTDASEELRRYRQQLLAFLLRNGIQYTGRTNWTQAHVRYLRGLQLPDPTQRIVLEEYILGVEAGVERKTRLEEHMKQVLADWDLRPWVDAFRALRGIDTVAAMTLVSELGDLSRFEHPCQLMSWLGLVPTEESSGSRRRQGAITKAGNTHARWMLVEVAHHYSRPPKISRALSLRQEGQSRAVIELSWRTQLRLRHRFASLRARKLHRNKVVVAVARELSGFLWELHAIVKSQHPHKQNTRMETAA